MLEFLRDPLFAIRCVPYLLPEMSPEESPYLHFQSLEAIVEPDCDHPGEARVPPFAGYLLDIAPGTRGGDLMSTDKLLSNLFSRNLRPVVQAVEDRRLLHMREHKVRGGNLRRA